METFLNDSTEPDQIGIDGYYRYCQDRSSEPGKRPAVELFAILKKAHVRWCCKLTACACFILKQHGSGLKFLCMCNVCAMYGPPDGDVNAALEHLYQYFLDVTGNTECEMMIHTSATYETFQLSLHKLRYNHTASNQLCSNQYTRWKVAWFALLLLVTESHLL